MKNHAKSRDCWLDSHEKKHKKQLLLVKSLWAPGSLKLFEPVWTFWATTRVVVCLKMGESIPLFLWHFDIFSLGTLYHKVVDLWRFFMVFPWCSGYARWMVWGVSDGIDLFGISEGRSVGLAEGITVQLVYHLVMTNIAMGNYGP